MHKIWTLNDVIDFVTAADDDSGNENDEHPRAIAIEPPRERPEVESDCDSDKSGDGNGGDVTHATSKTQCRNP